MVQPAPLPNNERHTQFECVYCAKQGFSDETQLDRHITQDCPIARSFRSPIVEHHSTAKTPSIAQGRMKRRGDVHAIRPGAMLQLKRESLSTIRSSNQELARDPLRPQLPNPRKPTVRTTPSTAAARAQPMTSDANSMPALIITPSHSIATTLPKRH